LIWSRPASHRDENFGGEHDTQRLMNTAVAVWCEQAVLHRRRCVFERTYVVVHPQDQRSLSTSVRRADLKLQNSKSSRAKRRVCANSDKGWHNKVNAVIGHCDGLWSLLISIHRTLPSTTTSNSDAHHWGQSQRDER